MARIVVRHRKIVQIKNWLITARSRQKSMRMLTQTDVFQVGDYGHVRSSPWKGRYSLWKQVNVLELPDNNSVEFINTLYVLNLKKCVADEKLGYPT
ncbi:hypothetical protein Tco_0573492 [Tanacetum coccineum]